MMEGLRIMVHGLFLGLSGSKQALQPVKRHLLA